MAVSEFINKLFARQTIVRREAANTWLQLVTQVSDGQNIDEHSTIEWLNKNGRTISELEEAVQLLNRRRELSQQVAAEVSARQRYREVGNQIAEKEAANEVMIRKLNGEVSDLRMEHSRLSAQLNESHQALEELKATAGPNLISELKAAKDRAARAYREVADAEQEVTKSEVELTQRKRAGVHNTVTVETSPRTFETRKVVNQDEVEFQRQLAETLDRIRRKLSELRTRASQREAEAIALEKRLTDPSEII